MNSRSDLRSDAAPRHILVVILVVITPSKGAINAAGLSAHLTQGCHYAICPASFPKLLWLALRQALHHLQERARIQDAAECDEQQGTCQPVRSMLRLTWELTVEPLWPLPEQEFVNDMIAQVASMRQPAAAINEPQARATGLEAV